MNCSIRSEDPGLDNFFSSLTELPILVLEGREETRTGRVSFLSARLIKNSIKVPGLAKKVDSTMSPLSKISVFPIFLITSPFFNLVLSPTDLISMLNQFCLFIVRETVIPNHP